MAFRFSWPEFDSGFYDEAKLQLETALNKGNKPKNIVDHITVKELHMGSKPPELEILEVGELTTDKFRGIFKLTYAGDAYIVLQTKVQANPMHNKRPASMDRHRLYRPGIVAADKPLVVPMLLRISDLKLRGIIVLVVSKTKGITLVFKNDPLESIIISSTFDAVTSVRNFLQREIEKQLRNLFQEDLPVMIHNLSVRHLEARRQQQERERQQQMMVSTPPLSITPSADDYMSDISSLPCTPAESVFDIPPPYTIPRDFASVYSCASQHQRYCYQPQSFPPSLYGGESACGSSSASSECSSIILDDQASIATTSAISSMYLSDEDAPWYIVEGPEIPSLVAQDCYVTFPQEIILKPTENGLVSQLARLTSIQHTLSPYSPAIAHHVCRSAPHTTGSSSPSSPSSFSRTRQKVPKRRIIRLKTPLL
ncbi:hypothetical protein BX666DRAFT_1908796 [Dichotomocladium elegans]|nr:hypothetical protein BX666DRAFT_1908796 [Dichotomocladium elegans]